MFRLKFLLPSGEATPGGSLAPVLAPFGLDLPRLSREINEKSLVLFPRGFPVSIKISLGNDKSYSIAVNRPPLSFYFSALFGSAPSSLSALAFYNLVLLLHGGRDSPWRTAHCLLGSLGSSVSFRSLKFSFS